MTVLLAIAALFALIVLALVGQDVAYYFLGHECVTARLVRKGARRRAIRIPCSRIRVTVRRLDDRG